MFDWDKAKLEAEKLDDATLTEQAKDAAAAFVVLWREADSRKYQSYFRLLVRGRGPMILSPPIGERSSNGMSATLLVGLAMRLVK